MVKLGGAMMILVAGILGLVGIAICVDAGIRDILEGTGATPVDVVQIFWGLAEAIGLPVAILVVLACLTVWVVKRRQS